MMDHGKASYMERKQGVGGQRSGERSVPYIFMASSKQDKSRLTMILIHFREFPVVNQDYA